MAEIGRWSNHRFEVSPSVIRSFTDLQIKGASETEDKESGGEKYVSRKNARPLEVSFTIHLHALLGCEVQNEAEAFVSEARAGAKDYFYLGNQKLCADQLMLTEAAITQVEIAPGGKWLSANVQLTLKQCGRQSAAPAIAGGSSGWSGAGGGSSVKQSVSQARTTTAANAAASLTAGAMNIVNSAYAAIEKMVTAAKTASARQAGVGSAGAQRVNMER